MEALTFGTWGPIAAVAIVLSLLLFLRALKLLVRIALFVTIAGIVGVVVASSLDERSGAGVAGAGIAPSTPEVSPSAGVPSTAGRR